MGVLTIAEIIEQGTELAGVTYDDTDTKPLAWLKQWLRSVALGWPWAETSEVVNAQLAAYAHELTLGIGGTVAPTRHITRMTFPIKIVYGDDYLPRDINQGPIIDAIGSLGSVADGTPDKASYVRTTPGAIKLSFNRKPTAAINLQISIQFDPSINYLTSDIPWYMNDDTMIHAIAHKTAEYHEGKDASVTRAFSEALSIMLRNDKLKFGNTEDFDLKLSRKFAGK